MRCVRRCIGRTRRVAGRQARPSYEDLCKAIEELVEERALERRILYEDWTAQTGDFADESDRQAIERMDLDLARYRELLHRARQP